MKIRVEPPAQPPQRTVVVTMTEDEARRLRVFLGRVDTRTMSSEDIQIGLYEALVTSGL